MRISDWSSDVCSSDLHALIQANFHPILTRYREIALAALRAPAQVQYARAHDQLLERATNMGLCRRELNHTGTRYYLKHRSEERRVGKERVGTGRSGWSAYH